MNLFDGGWIWGAVGLAVGVPILLVVLTETLRALERKGSPATKPLRLLRNWIVPVGALFGLLAFAFRSEEEHVWTRVVATVFGFLVILLILSAFNVAVFGNAKTGSWQQRIPTIFIEIVRLLLVVIALALLFSWVWNADVGGLIAALGVTSIVIGLALQNAVGGVISGLLLLFEQPFKIGDWLDVGSAEGRIVEVNWRAVHIDTGAGIQIVPNADLAGASFTNKSRPEGPFWSTVAVAFTTDDPPNEVMALLVEVAESLPDRSSTWRATASYAGNGKYSVSIPVVGAPFAGDAISLYLTWLWYAARRRGFALDGDSTDPIAEPAVLESAIAQVGPALHLADDDYETLTAASHLERYGRGEIVMAAGVVPSEIRYIISGAARLAVSAGADRIEFGVAEPGDFIGQTALTRERTQSVAIAGDVLTVLVIPLETLDDLVRTRPRLAAEIGESLELKRKAAAEALATAGVSRGLLALD